MSSLSELWHHARNPSANPVSPNKDNNTTYRDRAVLVTGAFGSQSLGHHAAIKYASLGANPLILAVRTAEKGDQAKDAIVRAAGCSPGAILVEAVDLASFASIVALADRVVTHLQQPSEGKGKGLHVLQLAAGVAPMSFTKSTEEPGGNEMSVMVNVLAPALLALLLLPVMRATPPSPPGKDGDRFVPHISFVDSIATFMIAEDDAGGMIPLSGGQTLIQRLNDASKWDFVQQYFLVKLATWFVAQSVADLVSGQEADDPGLGRVVVNATCPGLCKTEMGRQMPLVYRMFMEVRWFLFGRTAEMGARILVSATALGKESHGRFWTNDSYHEMTPFLKTERCAELHRETWDEVLSILQQHVSDGRILNGSGTSRQ